MATWTDDFTAGSDINLALRTDWQQTDGGNANQEITVYSATGRLYGRLASSADNCEFTRAGLPTGTQEVRLDYQSGADSTFRALMLALIGGTGGNLRYEAELISDGVTALGFGARLYRVVGGTRTSVATGLIVAASTLYSGVAFRVTVNAGVNVVLSLTVPGQSALTFTDTDASRPTSGRAGVGYHGDNTGTSWIDNFVVDDLQVAGNALAGDDVYMPAAIPAPGPCIVAY